MDAGWPEALTVVSNFTVSPGPRLLRRITSSPTRTFLISKRYTVNRADGMRRGERFSAVVDMTYPCRLPMPGRALNCPKVKRRFGSPVAGQSMVCSGVSLDLDLAEAGMDNRVSTHKAAKKRHNFEAGFMIATMIDPAFDFWRGKNS